MPGQIPPLAPLPVLAQVGCRQDIEAEEHTPPEQLAAGMLYPAALPLVTWASAGRLANNRPKTSPARRMLELRFDPYSTVTTGRTRAGTRGADRCPAARTACQQRTGAGGAAGAWIAIARTAAAR
jgi:hypothetical protein